MPVATVQPSGAKDSAAEEAVRNSAYKAGGAKGTRRERFYHWLENDPRLTAFIMVMIVFSTVCFILESHFRDPASTLFFGQCEFVAVVVFSIEYVCRICATSDRLKFAIQPMNIVDLLAILPFYLTEMGLLNASFSFVRSIRLVRVFRVFKFGRYSVGIKIFTGAIKMSFLPLSILLFMMLITMILFSSLMILAEDDERQPHPVVFKSIPNCFWWCLVTMTTVGYGDAVPYTPAGKIVATFTMISGLLILALPITVVGSNFSKMMEIYEEDMHLYSAADTDKSGNVDEDELRVFLHTKRKEGALPPEFHKTAAEVISEYDEEGKVYLTERQFMALTNAILLRANAIKEPTTGEIMTMIKSTKESLEGRLTHIEQMVAQLSSLQPPQSGKL